MKEQEEFEIPMDLVDPDFTSPRNLILIAKHKVGKTTICAQIPNSLILDFEKGTSFLSARKVYIEHYSDLNKVSTALRKQNIELDYVIVDTATKMSEMALVLAEKLYSESPIGTHWIGRDKEKYHSILNLPKGAGYYWFRVAFTKLINKIKTFAPRVIFIAHTKDETLLSGTSEIETLDIDLPGQLKRLLAQDSDAIGYVYRKGKQNIISFKTKDTVTCGARQPHLREKEFIISEMDPTNENVINTYWDQIYID